MAESTETAPPKDAGARQPTNPPFIRSGHLNAAGFSEHQIYWEEYGALAGEPMIAEWGIEPAALAKAKLHIRPYFLRMSRGTCGLAHGLRDGFMDRRHTRPHSR